MSANEHSRSRHEIATHARSDETILTGRERHPAEGIIATAERNGCDLIVMASHGRRAVGRVLLGSQAVEVLSHSKVPALIVR